MAGRALTIDITTKDQQTLAALKRVQKELKDTGGAAQRTSKQGLSVGSALGGIAVGAGLRAAIGEFEEAETSAAQTAAVIKSTGNAAGISAIEQDKLVNSLSKLAAVDDEVVNGGANVLRTFTAIKGANFGEALAKSLDLAAAKNMDLSSSAELVGKALQDPEKGYQRLKRAGVDFDATQIQLIKTMSQAGDVAGAQGVILKELETEYGGSAEANVTSTAKMKVAFGNAAESAGQILAPALSVAADAAEKAGAAFSALPGPLQGAVLGGAALAVVGPKIFSAFQSAAQSIELFRYGLAGATQQGAGAANALGGAISSVGGLSAVAAPAAAAVGIVAVGLAEAAANSARAEENVSSLVKLMQSGLSPIEAFGTKLANTLAGVDGGFALETTGDKFRGFIEDAGISVEELGKALTGSDADFQSFIDSVEVLGPTGSKAFASTEQLKYQLEKLRGEGKQSTDQTKTLANAQKALGVETDNATDATVVATKEEKSYSESLRESVDAAQAASSARQAVTAAEEGRNDAIVAVADAQQAEADAAEQVQQAVEGVTSAQRGLRDARRAVADAERGVADALKAEESARRGVVEAEKGAAQARADLATATQDLATAQREATGDSDAMRDALAGVARAEEGVQQSQADSLDAQQDLTDARNDYEHTLRNLSDAAGGAADDVLSAEIRLRKAQENLATLGQNSDGTIDPVSADDRTEAEIAIREAERRLRAAQDAAAQAAADLARNQENGVEGSDAVVAAHEAVQTAAENEATAHSDLEAAVTNVASVQVQADANVQAAHERVLTATENVAAANQRVIDAKDAVVAAQLATQTAVQGVADANERVRDAARSVNEANDGVVKARGAVVTAHGAIQTAVDGVYQKTRDLADAQFAADGNLRTYITSLGALAGTINPNTPMRRDLDSLIADLERREILLTGAQPVVPPTRDPDSRAPGGARSRTRSAERSSGGDTITNHISIDVHGVDDPAATAEMVSRRLGKAVATHGKSR